MRRWTFLLLALFFHSATLMSWSAARAEITAFDANARLGRAINLGNALEAPQEGEWGLKLEEVHFEEIAKAGFQAVRVPIRWSAHASDTAPYTIAPEFWERIDWVIRQAHRQQLAIILDMHHDDPLMADPSAHRDRFLKLWEQIAERYQAESDEVYFELLNEPHDKLDAATWNSLLADAVAVIRRSNPNRFLIVGGSDWNSINALETLQLPADDRRLIVTFHYYLPFEFTHQGAEWVAQSSDWVGRKWSGAAEEKQAIVADLDRAQQWAEKQQRPLFLGEFGSYSKADLASRAAWTQFLASQAASRQMASAYWEFASGFGAYERDQRRWVPELLQALEPRNVFDVDGDSRVRRRDFQELSKQIVDNKSTDLRLDLNRSGVVDGDDLKFWSHYAGPDTGDFDGNGRWETKDIDDLTVAINEKSTSSSRYDVDHDGAVNDQDRRVWVEVIMETFFGDANLDGQFDNVDVVGVYATGHYEDKKAKNSGWAQGDFNGDQEFTAADFVLAMQSGAFEKGPRKSADR